MKTTTKVIHILYEIHDRVTVVVILNKFILKAFQCHCARTGKNPPTYPQTGMVCVYASTFIHPSLSHSLSFCHNVYSSQYKASTKLRVYVWWQKCKMCPYAYILAITITTTTESLKSTTKLRVSMGIWLNMYQRRLINMRVHYEKGANTQCAPPRIERKYTFNCIPFH